MNLDGTGVVAITGADANRYSGSTATGLQKLVYESLQTGDSEVFASNFDGSSPVNLTNNMADDLNPVMSADGSKVAFYSTRMGTLGLYLMSSTGTGLQTVTTMTGLLDDFGLGVNTDGSKVVFVAAPSGVTQIYIANSDGTGLANLSNNLNDDDESPCFSPDGSTILFARLNSLYTMSTTGTNKTLLFTGLTSVTYPSYTSDGSKIVFRMLVNGAWDLFVMNANGTGLTNLTSTPIDELKSSGYIGL
jgi:TolB protein